MKNARYAFSNKTRYDIRVIQVCDGEVVASSRHYERTDTWDGDPKVVWDSRWEPTIKSLEYLLNSESWQLTSCQE